MNLELLEWGDNTIRLTYWDSFHGKDIIFILAESGQVFRVEVIGSDEKLTLIDDFVLALRQLVTVEIA
jgi:hypothetical protein